MNTEKILLVEGEEVSLSVFLKTNLADSEVLPITDEEIETVNTLEVGEVAFIGIVEVKRIS